MKDFNLDNLDKKNIYKIPDHLFENIQNNVMSRIEIEQQQPIQKTKKYSLNVKWAYAFAAAVAMVFGVNFVLDSQKQSKVPMSDTLVKTDSQKAYEILQSDLQAVESMEQQRDMYVAVDKKLTKQTEKKQTNIVETTKVKSKISDDEMAIYLDILSDTEYADLANNGTQDVYLDLYN